MKIRSISISNINSIASATVDFTQEPLANAGLFLINGRTGAGKSTLLDAITLALYNRIPRYSSTSDSINNVLRRGAAEASAAVEFEVIRRNEHGKAVREIYRSEWSIRRAHRKVDGELQSAKMAMYILSDDKQEQLSSKLSEVPKLVAERTGLDFEQCMRSLILPQGEFARFLRSKDDEKGALLEKLTNIDKFRSFGKYVYTYYKSEEQRLMELKNQIHSISLLSEEQEQELHARIAYIQNRNIALNNRIEELESFRRQHEAYSAAVVRLHEAEQTLATLRKEQENQFPLLSQSLEQHNKALSLQPLLKELDEAEKQHKKLFLLQNESRTLLEQQYSEQQLLFQSSERVEIELLESSANLQNFNYITLPQAQQLQKEKDKKEADIEYRSNEIKDITSKTHTYQLGITSLQTTISALRESVAKNSTYTEENKKFAHAINVLPDDTVLHEYLGLRNEFSTLKKDIDTATAAIRAYETQLLDVQNKKNAISNEIEELQKNRLSIEKYIEQVVAEDSSLNVSADVLHSLENDVKECITTLEKLQKHQLQLGQLLTEQHNLNNDVTTLQEQLLASEHSYQTALAIFSDKQKIQQYLLRVQSLEAQRASLIQGEPCPLCGSVEHPFAHNSLIPDEIASATTELQSAEEELTQAQTKLQKQKDSITRTEERRKFLQQSIEQSEQEINSLRAKNTFELQQLSEQKAILLRFTEISSEETLFQQETLQQILENIRKEYTNKHKLQEQLRKLQKELQQVQNTLQALHNNKSGEEEKFHSLQQSLFQMQQEQIRLQEKITQQTERGQELNKQISSTLQNFDCPLPKSTADWQAIKQQISEKQLLLEQTEKALQHDKEILASKTELLLLQERQLQEQHSLLQEKQVQLKELQTEHTTITNKLRELIGNSSIEILQSNLQTIHTNLQLEKERLLSKRKHCSEKILDQEQRLQELQQQVSESAEIEEHLKNRSNSILDELGFSSREELEHTLLTSDELQRINDEIAGLKHRLTAAVEQQQLAMVEAQQLSEQCKELPPETEIIQQIVTYRNENDALQQELGASQQKLNEHHRNVANNRIIYTKIQEQEKRLQLYGKLHTLIGSADGDKFNKYAQAITLRQLVFLANRRLQSLGSPYQLQSSKKLEQGLSLSVFDRILEQERPIASLSGGETFIVSLALSLALSELTGGELHLGSLFIDEGFGTLDAVTLESVLATLESLQSEGKQIGIISHVTGLRERIRVAIHVRKNNSGTSTVTLETA